ncbi:sensor histidine kinase [Streptomyces eurocidicus]|uniref:sensor histidine kinase n=1 Tax=Streptomyces eurocidicus TaxID=66423 RepID=UPI001FD15C62|nr:histidine kinase [Streptomyces eurocidicus]
MPVPYAPPPADQGFLSRCRWIVQDTQTWRDWLWVTLDPVVGVALAFLPIGLVLSGLWGMGLAFYGVDLSAAWEGLWFDFIPVEGRTTAYLAGVLGLLHLPLALWLAPRTVRAHGAWTRRLLAPSEAARMAERIEHLSVTRSDAVDTQMAEIRRIERDLHDGAQARLVAMGMTLDAAEHLLGSNPEAVRALLIEARESSSKALEELRDLVRGIHPPVLADRGLADAVRALALVSPLTTDVTIDLPGRPEPPVESAVYFAVSEVLANAAKHSGGDRVWLDLRYGHGMLRVGITDDGRGGADITRGTGLRGIERRLATFDGVLAVSSPLNGPTMVTMEIPCALSSPKTTSC